MTVGLLFTALTLGFRHGVDWDHIAAIADLSAAAKDRRRGFVLSFVYACGHAVVVFVLGVAAIIFGSALPDGLDEWMGRLVGATLVVLGLWIAWDLARSGREFRLRSRWILVLNGTFAGLRRVRDAAARRQVVVEHGHDHDHGEIVDHQMFAAHDHAHSDEALTAAERSIVEPIANHAKAGTGSSSVGAGSVAAAPGAAVDSSTASMRRHGHRHRHDLYLSSRTHGQTGNGTAAGIGMLHGIGFESPTQIAVFVASTSVAGTTAGLAMLGAWIVGLLLANTVLAAFAGWGMLNAERNFAVYAAIAVVVAIASVAMGLLLITGIDALPELLV